MIDFAGTEELPATDVPVGHGPMSVPKERPLVLLALAALVLLAIALRLFPVIFVPSVNWPDEIFQATEPAHRLVYGYGIVPWEFQLGMRSWLLPGVIAGLMELALIAGDGPNYYLPLIATAFALLASAPVVCCFLWVRCWYGLIGAFASAAAAAIAPELIYFGARALTEVAAAHLLVIGCYLLEPGYAVNSRRRLFAAGALFGLVCFLRIHLAPAVAVIVIWSVWRRWRAQFPALLAGGLLVLALGAVLDWATLGYPLASIWRNVVYNLFYGVNTKFGTAPWDHYLLGGVGIWGAGILFLLFLAVLGARRLPALLIAAIAIVAAHSCIAHKEYRFIYPATVLLTVLAGIGVAQLADWGARRLGSRGVRSGTAITVSAVFVVGYWGSTAFNVWRGEEVRAPASPRQ